MSSFGGRTALQGAPRPGFFVILLQGHLSKVTVPGPASGYGRCPSCGVSRTSVLAEGGRRDFTGVQEGIPDWGFLPTWDADFPEMSWSDQHSLQHSCFPDSSAWRASLELEVASLWTCHPFRFIL